MSDGKRDTFNTIVAEVLGIAPAQVTDDLTAERVDAWDSLNHINIITSLEEEFGVTLPTTSFVEAGSVRALKAQLAAVGVTL